MPPRSPKMKRRILGFQRRVWWPKCTPASSSSLIPTWAMWGPFPLFLPAAGGLDLASRSSRAPRGWPGRSGLHGGWPPPGALDSVRLRPAAVFDLRSVGRKFPARLSFDQVKVGSSPPIGRAHPRPSRLLPLPPAAASALAASNPAGDGEAAVDGAPPVVMDRGPEARGADRPATAK